MRIIHIILAGWMLVTVSNTCRGKDWRGITPLKSSRADVERLLGRPTGRYQLIICRTARSLFGTHIVDAETNVKTIGMFR